MIKKISKSALKPIICIHHSDESVIQRQSHATGGRLAEESPCSEVQTTRQGHHQWNGAAPLFTSNHDSIV